MTDANMRWYRKFGIILLIMILMVETFHVSGREFRDRKLKSDKKSIRLKRLNAERQRNRLLQRLLETSLISKRYRINDRSRWSSDLNEYEDEDELVENEWNHGKQTQLSVLSPTIPFTSKNSKERKRNDENIVDKNITKSCCPQKFEVVEPYFAKNRTGHVVELYKDRKIQQRFYELICDPTIEEKPCRFIQEKKQKFSKCTQQHAYTYALVRTKKMAGWSLDHIKIRSGCVCKIYPTFASKPKKQIMTV